MDNDITAQEPQPTPESVWKTLHPEWFLRHFLQPPPRRWSYLSQLRLDAAGAKPRILWILAGAFLLAGFSLRAWFAVAIGASLLGFWIICFLFVVQSMRTDRVGTGVLRSIRPNPIAREASFASVVLPDGTVIEVGVITALVTGFLERHGQCEVLFHAGSHSASAGGMVFAAREIVLGSSSRPAYAGASEILVSASLRAADAPRPSHSPFHPSPASPSGRRARYLLPFLAGIAMVTPLPHSAEPPPYDQHEIQGDWKLVSMVSRGERLGPRDLLGSATLKIRGDRWSEYMWVDGVVLDPRREPKRLDGLTVKTAKPRRMQGIYKIEDGKLTVSWGMGVRPVSLRDVKKWDILFQFEREKREP